MPPILPKFYIRIPVQFYKHNKRFGRIFEFIIALTLKKTWERMLEMSAIDFSTRFQTFLLVQEDHFFKAWEVICSMFISLRIWCKKSVHKRLLDTLWCPIYGHAPRATPLDNKIPGVCFSVHRSGYWLSETSHLRDVSALPLVVPLIGCDDVTRFLAIELSVCGH